MNAPKFITWLIAVILGVLGIISHLGIVAIPGVFGYSFWFVTAGFALLAIATAVRGL